MKKLAILFITLLAFPFSTANAKSEIKIHHARVHKLDKHNAAVFMLIHNPHTEAVKLTRAHTNAAARVEFHRNPVAEDGTSNERKLGWIEIPGKGSKTLEPTGTHLMLVNVPASLTGDVHLTLYFNNKEIHTIRARVVKSKS